MKYALIGKKLEHSLSPRIHTSFGCKEYELQELDSIERLGELIATGEYGGFNVTIPYKRSVESYCDRVTELAKRIGSINTLYHSSQGGFVGDNTDYYGFEWLLNAKEIDPYNKKCLVLGSGGASLTVQAVLSDKGAREVVVISRTGENNYENIENHSDADILINATPVGMYPDQYDCPVDIAVLPKLSAVVDLIYNPLRTKLLIAAEDRGLLHSNGLGMLIAQARRADELFLARQVRTSVATIEGDIMYSRLNIVLIGMPYSGKSTIGATIAKHLRREFIDCDVEIERRYGKKPRDIITAEGEQAFRKLESEVIQDICKGTGKVIATGGGVVTIPECRDMLKSTGIVFYIDRNIRDLKIDGRPISAKAGVEKLYEVRKPLYEHFADVKIKNNSPSDCAKRITSIFGEKSSAY